MDGAEDVLSAKDEFCTPFQGTPRPNTRYREKSDWVRLPHFSALLKFQYCLGGLPLDQFRTPLTPSLRAVSVGCFLCVRFADSNNGVLVRCRTAVSAHLIFIYPSQYRFAIPVISESTTAAFTARIGRKAWVDTLQSPIQFFKQSSELILAVAGDVDWLPCSDSKLHRTSILIGVVVEARNRRINSISFRRFDLTPKRARQALFSLSVRRIRTIRRGRELPVFPAVAD